MHCGEDQVGELGRGTRRPARAAARAAVRRVAAARRRRARRGRRAPRWRARGGGAEVDAPLLTGRGRPCVRPPWLETPDEISAWCGTREAARRHEAELRVLVRREILQARDAPCVLDLVYRLTWCAVLEDLRAWWARRRLAARGAGRRRRRRRAAAEGEAAAAAGVEAEAEAEAAAEAEAWAEAGAEVEAEVEAEAEAEAGAGAEAAEAEAEAELAAAALSRRVIAAVVASAAEAERACRRAAAQAERVAHARRRVEERCRAASALATTASFGVELGRHARGAAAYGTAAHGTTRCVAAARRRERLARVRRAAPCSAAGGQRWRGWRP